MLLTNVADAVKKLMVALETQPMSEQVEVLIQQTGMKTETFDLMSLPLRARPAFARLILLLMKSVPEELMASTCATAYISAVAISHAYEDPNWREKLE